jgi:hypothetical protein
MKEVEAPRFRDNRLKKVVSLSALRSGRRYPQERFLVPIYVRGCSIPGPQCGRKNYKELWKIPMTRHLPDYSKVPSTYTWGTLYSAYRVFGWHYSKIILQTWLILLVFRVRGFLYLDCLTFILSYIYAIPYSKFSNLKLYYTEFLLMFTSYYILVVLHLRSPHLYDKFLLVK